MIQRSHRFDVTPGAGIIYICDVRGIPRKRVLSIVCEVGAIADKPSGVTFLNPERVVLYETII